MASRFLQLLIGITICVSSFVFSNPNFVVSSPIDESLILDFHGDYSPPSPPPPSPPPHTPPLSCEEDLLGIGSLDTTCELNSSLIFVSDVYIEGKGSLHILPGVKFRCHTSGCSVIINVSSEFRLGLNSEIVAGTFHVTAGNATFEEGSIVNVTALAGDPPEHTSGTPKGLLGGGGGHGGRGASCVVDNKKLPEDVWGGDAYGWSDLPEPYNYGSNGGTTSKEEDYGGNGGGRVWIEVAEAVETGGRIFANGGEGGVKGGGGSGGSIYVKSRKMTGSGILSASGGNGFAGGAGGRISVNVFSRRDDQTFFAHGGQSYGCPTNSGAAGTFYDAVPRRLRVNNHNMSTDTDTPFFAFPNQPRWTGVDIQEYARAAVFLRWSRVQVQGQLSLSSAAVLSFGLPHDAVSEFELMAEELLMSDSVIKIYGALRMSVKLHLMLNSKMLIDGDGEGDPIIATSLLEASNLLVLKGGSVIRSNANLGVHGQGSLNLTGAGNSIEAQHLVLSIFCCINVEPGSVLRGPLENTTNDHLAHCGREVCPMELIHPPEDCNVNASLSFTLQICRVEEIVVEGSIEGSVVHFHWVRTVVVKPSGAISASGLGCIGGAGQGIFLNDGPSGGGGHGGKGGDGYYNESLIIEGGVTYGNPDLPCELGSGSGNDSLGGGTAGGDIIVNAEMQEHRVKPTASIIDFKPPSAENLTFERGKNGSIKRAKSPITASSYTVAALQTATNSFSQENIIGEGSLGRVYRAEFPNGKIMAVKKIDDAALSLQEEDNFVEAISNMSRLRHPNIVPLAGYCAEHGQRLLVFDYIANGSLQDLLHFADERSKTLTWNARVRVALGAARALDDGFVGELFVNFQVCRSMVHSQPMEKALEKIEESKTSRHQA